ncbi:thionin-like protein 2 [Mercurialis annua]|uniref:thionin-like protein 2 n=1 Tax=Mercurialis annua TaxID=3986 RepID=UPI00215F0976|nr:thionin-like protein 2 [Mercurialis annua]
METKSFMVVLMVVGLVIGQSHANFAECYSKCYMTCIVSPGGTIESCVNKCLSSCTPTSNLLVDYKYQTLSFCKLGCATSMCINLSSIGGNRGEHCLDVCSKECAKNYSP